MVKEEKVYKCKTCGREFKSSPALSAHLKKHKREEEGAKTPKPEELRTIVYYNSNLTQPSLTSSSNTIQQVIPSPIPQQQNPIPPNPYDFLIITNYQQQQQPRQQTTPSCLEFLIRIFSSPAGVEIVKLIRDIVNLIRDILKKKDDSESSKILYSLRYDSFNTMWSVTKNMMSNLTGGYVKGLENYYKEFYKRKVIIESEKLEVLHFPPSKPQQPLTFDNLSRNNEGVFVEEEKKKEDGIIINEDDKEDGVFIQ